MSEQESQHLAQIRRSVAAVEVRMRLGRAIRALPALFTAALAVAAGTLAVRKTLPSLLSEHHARQILIGAGALVGVALVVALLRRLPPNAGSIALDRAHGLADRLTNALSFAALPKADRTPLMEVAIEDACERANGLAPRKAAPLPFSRELLVPLGVGAGVVLLAMLEIRTVHQDPPPKSIDALQMSADDIELFKDVAKDLAAKDQSPEVRSAVDRFNQLIEDIAQKRLERSEAFRQMEAIERDLLKGEEADRKQLEDALKETALDLKKSDLAKPLGESLEKKDLDKAKKDLKDLADRLRDNTKKKPDKAELDRLRKALAEAAARRKEALAAINDKRAEMQEELLKKKRTPKDPDAGAPDPKEEELLKKKERELERLDREAEQKERVGRQLDKLDRDLAKAAEDLMRDMGASAEDLDQAAEDINRMQEEQMSDKEKEELRQRLEELRELLRQQGQGGKQRMARMQKFGKRARGGSKGEKGEKGDPGQGEPGEGEDGDGDDKGQDGQNGKGGQKPGGQKWAIGPGGKKILIPGMGQGQGQSPGQGDGQGQGQGQGDSPGNGGNGTDPGGKGIGSGHDGDVKGKATDPKMGTEDVQAQGLDSQQGPSNSEVILGAAEKGFKGGGYKKVYTQYHTVAEQQVNKDEIPDGYRFYVRRYFQLIRPRD